MTKRRYAKLNDQQKAEIVEWAAARAALGSRAEHMARAVLAWQAKRRQVRTIKQMCAQYDVTPDTLRKYAKGLHKNSSRRQA